MVEEEVGEVTTNANNPDNLARPSLIRRIKGLQYASLVGKYSMWNAMTYLTKVWMFDITQAAGIVNLYWGLIGVISIAMKFLADTIMGNYWMLLLSSLAYCCGLGFLSMSTPPVLTGAIGNCSAYKPECIGGEQRFLFYVGLTLTALGMSSRKASLIFFLADQGGAKSDKDYVVYGLFLLISVIAVIAIALTKPWSLKFGVPAICFVVATIGFLTGSPSYNYVAPQGSPLTTLFRVFVAAASKIFHRLPSDSGRLYEEERELGLHWVPHTRTLRCLDKGAIIVQQNESKWRLCRVTEIEETKMLIRLIPVCMTFIMCGVVLSIGNTYFIEQAYNMNNKVGKLHVPIQVLQVFSNIAQVIFSNLGKSGFRFGIPTSMIFSILCCTTAAKVETRRLHIITSLDLLEKPDVRISMSIFWLVPQFLLLGALQGLSIPGFVSFFKYWVPHSKRDCYFDFFSQAVGGVGYIGAVLSVYVVGKISERGGREPSWFQHTLNKSRLDNYYWTLAAMAAVNLIFFILISVWHASWESEELEDMKISGNDETPKKDNLEDLVTAVC